MLELYKGRYEILLDSIMKIPFNTLMARSVIVGDADGRVFVSSYESPQSFYIIHSSGMTFLCGDSTDEDFNKGLFNYFHSISNGRKKDEWLQAFPRDWDVVMQRLIDENKATLHERLNFKFDLVKFNETYKQMGKTLHEVISPSIETLFELHGSVVPKDYWRSHERFNDIAKAFSVMIDGKLAATAFASARHDNQLEIGIETVKEHHGKGLAYLVCAKLVEYCIDNDLEPVWSCRSGNIGSVNLAKKLGFVESLRMPYYHVPF